MITHLTPTIEAPYLLVHSSFSTMGTLPQESPWELSPGAAKTGTGLKVIISKKCTVEHTEVSEWTVWT